MKAINESSLITSLDSGSTKRLKSFRQRLSSDKLDVSFDKQVKEMVLEFSRKPDSVRAEIDYLNNLVDDRGVPFARSIKEYSLMEETWDQFAKHEKDSFRWAKSFQTAESVVRARYSTARLQALTYQSDDDIVDALTELGTSSGWTSISEGLSKKRDVIGGVKATFDEKVSRAMENGSFNSPMLPGVRTQCSGEYTDSGLRTGTCKHKTRPIWMVDVYTVIAERMWAKPLTNWLRSYPYSAIGKDDYALMKRIGSMRIMYENWISVDYSKFDSSIPSWLIDSAFSIIASAFSTYDAALLKVLKDDFICKNLITGDGVVYVNHGNPSGSGFTAIVNGICNEIMTETWAAYLHMSNKMSYIIMGDDNLIYFNTQVDKATIASYLMHNFGVKVNEDKTTLGKKGDDPEFLSRIWTIGGAYRHPNQLLSKLLFPEKWRNHNLCPPELVIYSYILAYPMGMRELIDVQKFLLFMKDRLKNLEVSPALVKLMPYNVQLAYETNHGVLPWLETRARSA